MRVSVIRPTMPSLSDHAAASRRSGDLAVGAAASLSITAPRSRPVKGSRCLRPRRPLRVGVRPNCCRCPGPPRGRRRAVCADMSCHGTRELPRSPVGLRYLGDFPLEDLTARGLYACLRGVRQLVHMDRLHGWRSAWAPRGRCRGRPMRSGAPDRHRVARLWAEPLASRDRPLRRSGVGAGAFSHASLTHSSRIGPPTLR